MLRTVFASSMFQACAYSDSGIGLVEAAKRLGHSVNTSLVSYVKRVDDPRLSLATPLRPAVPAPSVAAVPIAPMSVTTTRVAPHVVAAAVPRSGFTPQPTTLRGNGRSKPIRPRSPTRQAKRSSPTRRPINHSSTKGQEAGKSPTRIANRLGQQRQPPASLDSFTSQKATARRTPRSPSRSSPSPRRRNPVSLAGGKGEAAWRSTELWHLPLQPIAANLSIADLRLQIHRA